MKRTIPFILALLLCISLFAGCGSNGSSVSESNGASETETPVSEPSETEFSGTEASAEAGNEDDMYPLTEEEVSFSMWTITAPPALAISDTLDGYNYAIMRAEELTNVHIDWVMQSPLTVMESFNIMVSSGTYTDFINGFSGNYTAGPASAIDDDIIYSLNDYMELMPNYTAALEKYNSTTDVKTDDGDVYGIAMLNDAEEPLWLGLVARQDWLYKLGLEAPETIEEYENVLTAFVNNYESCSNGALWIAPLGGNVNDCSWASAFDTTIGSPYAKYNGFLVTDGKVEYGPTKSGYKDYLTLMADWYAKGLIYQDFTSAETIDTVAADINGVTSGKYGIMNMMSGDLPTAMDSTEAGFDLVPLKFPVSEEGQELHVGTAPRIVDICMSISTECEDVELACKYWDWFFTEEAIELSNYGLEGETYTRDADGNVEYTEKITSADSLGGLADYFYLIRGTFPGVFYMNFRTLYGKSELEATARTVWTESCGWDYMLPTCMTLSSDEGSTVSATIADISTYVTESTLQFITGEKSLDEYDNYLQEIENMGIQEVTDAYQAAYDRYISR